MQTVLSTLTAADIRLDPFPHVLIPDVLDPTLYMELCRTWPTLEDITWAGAAHVGSNRRFEMSAAVLLSCPDIVPAWGEFVGRHISAEFLSQVAALFRDHWPPSLLAALNGSLTGHSLGLLRPGGFKSARILMDARFEINTPVTGPASVSRGPHVDRPERLYSGLLYFRHPDDDSVGGDLQLLRWRNGVRRRIDQFQLPESDIEIVTTIPYRANQLVLFPNRIDALHGVTMRHPTPHLRRYVFLTAEIAHPWMAADVAADPATGRAVLGDSA